jgi:hypothetical protein
MQRSNDKAGAEVVGALILFGVFVATIAILNVTAVPNAGRATEHEHYEQTLAALNALQAEAETAGLPGAVGSTVARSIDLAPPRSVGQDFFSYFMATPARASGELTFEPDYGNILVQHTKAGSGTQLNDVGAPGEEFPVGKLTFDPHPIFGEPSLVQLENAGVVTGESGAAAMRFDPPISVVYDADTQITNVSIKVRVLAGDSFSIGGIAPVRATLRTEAATLQSPVNPNAATATMTLETEHGVAWQEFLERASAPLDAAGVDRYDVVLEEDVDGDVDRVTWTILGEADTGNDIRLATALAIYDVSVS